MKEVTISELQRDAARILKSLASGPVVLNRNGRASAVLLDPTVFQRLSDELDEMEKQRVVRIIEVGLEDWKAGRVTPHEELARALRVKRAARRKASSDAARRMDKRS